MPLGIYTSADPGAQLSQSGFTNPLLVQTDGRTGGVFEKRLYARNSDPAYSYSGVQISVYDPTSDSVTNGHNGFSWKLHAGDSQPTEPAWSYIDSANSITLSGVLGTSIAPDIGMYLPFWLRIATPRNTDIQNITAVKLRTTAVQFLI